jgi:nitroreductase
MDVLEAIRTTRAMRRLDPDRPVADEDIRTIVQAGIHGPTGGNSQPVRWLVVTDAEKRRRLGAIYRECWQPVQKMYEDGARGASMDERVLRSATYLGDHMGDAPVIIIPCAQGDAGRLASSVFGCIQNLMVAARSLGLGTTLTTVHTFKEDEVRQVLDIPADVTTFDMIQIGYPTGRWGEAKRRPVREVTYWDAWKTPPPV